MSYFLLQVSYEFSVCEWVNFEFVVSFCIAGSLDSIKPSENALSHPTAFRVKPPAQRHPATGPTPSREAPTPVMHGVCLQNASAYINLDGLIVEIWFSQKIETIHSNLNLPVLKSSVIIQKLGPDYKVLTLLPGNQHDQYAMKPKYWPYVAKGLKFWIWCMTYLYISCYKLIDCQSEY